MLSYICSMITSLGDNLIQLFRTNSIKMTSQSSGSCVQWNRAIEDDEHLALCIGE